MVAEVSSFQLACSETFHPRVAVLLAITPDHLDWHGSYASYVAAKARITRRQTADDVLVFDADDADAAAIAAAGSGARIGFLAPVRRDADTRARSTAGSSTPTATLIANVDDMRRALRARSHERAGSRARGARGRRDHRGHPRRARDRTRPSLIASRWSAKLVGCTGTTIRRRPIPTRRCARSSRSTRSCCSRAVATRVSTSRCSAARASRFRGVVAFGEAGPEVAAAFRELGTGRRRSDRCTTRCSRPRALAQPGDAVLLSPACASFDAYANYGERGDDFAAEVASLSVEGAPT